MPYSPKSFFQRLQMLALLCIPMTLQSANAGSYLQSFGFAPTDGSIFSSNNGSTKLESGKLRITSSARQQSTGGFRVPDLDPENSVKEFTVSFDITLATGAVPADGFALSFGSLENTTTALSTNTINHGEGGITAANNLVVGFDLYNNGNSEAPAVRAIANGTVIKWVSMRSESSPGGGWIPDDRTTPYQGRYPLNNKPLKVVIHWEINTGLDVSMTGKSGSMASIMSNINLPGFRPKAGDVFAWTARTGGNTFDSLLDNISIQTIPATIGDPAEVAITEFLAENEHGIEDDQCKAQDWMELYNRSSISVPLAGWFLTDDPFNLTKWPFPVNYTLAPHQFAVLWADGQDRTAGSNIHLNFALSKTSGFLALVRPDQSIASQFNYLEQEEDVSYGTLGTTNTIGYLATPTPGQPNAGLQSPGLPCAEQVVLSRDGGLFPAAFTLQVTPPVNPAVVARYTLDKTDPTSSSKIFPAAGIRISATTFLRARYFETGHLPGKILTRTFIPLHSSLANYRGRGTPFSSSLPIVILDSFGADVDAQNGLSRPLRDAHVITIDKDPANSNKAVITGPIDAQSRAGVHIRGETSAGFPQRPYGFECWDNNRLDTSVSLFGWPKDSDYVLVSNFNDKSLIRNMLPFDTRLAAGKQGSAMRVKFVEVFFKQNGTGPLSYSDYRGIYVLTEKIKVDEGRVDIAKLEVCDNTMTNDPAIDDAAPISGGYIIRKDKPSPLPAIKTKGGTASGVFHEGQTFQVVAPEIPTTTQKTYLTGFLNRFETALFGSGFTNPTTGYAKYVDVDSWIDGHLWVELFKQFDGYRVSTYLYKDRGGKLTYSPLWDYNVSLGNSNPIGGYRPTSQEPTGWFYEPLAESVYPYHPRMFQDPKFLRRYWDRYWELRRGIFSTENIIARIDSYIALLKNGTSTVKVTNGNGIWPSSTPSLDVPVGRHHARWQRLGLYDWPNPTGFELRTVWETGISASSITGTTNPLLKASETSFVKTWLLRRLMWMDSQSNSYGNIVRNFKPPTLSKQGGNVPDGFSLSITNPNTNFSGTVYYTLEGSDPADGTGIPLSGSLVLHDSAEVKARVRNSQNEWSPLSKATFIVNTVPADAANIVVSEFHYNPHPPTPAETQASGATEGGDFEFIELQNIGSQPVDLTDCQFTEGITFQWANVAPQAKSLRVGARLVIVSNLAAFTARYGTAGMVVAGEFSGSLSNSGETLTLAAADGSPIRSFTYDDVAPWPPEADTQLDPLGQVISGGYSLVLKEPATNPDHNLATNWEISAAFHGHPGTDGTLARPAATVAQFQTIQDPAALLAYALGTSATPHAPQLGWQEFAMESGTERCFTVSYTINLTASDATVIPEVTSDLSDWENNPIPMIEVSSVDNGNGTATVTWRSTEPSASLPEHVFARLRVTRP